MRPSIAGFALTAALAAVLACAPRVPPAAPPEVEPAPGVEASPDVAPTPGPGSESEDVVAPPPLADSEAAWPTDAPEVDLFVHLHVDEWLAGGDAADLASIDSPGDTPVDTPVDSPVDPFGIPSDLGRHLVPGLRDAAATRSARTAGLWIAADLPYEAVSRALFSLGFAGVSRMTFAVSASGGHAWIPFPPPTLSDEPGMVRAEDRCVTRTVTVRGGEVTDVRQLAVRTAPAKEGGGGLLEALASTRWTFEDLDAEPSAPVAIADYRPETGADVPCPRALVTASPSTSWQQVVWVLDRLHAAGHDMPIFALPTDG
jgi:hypothetical protein